MTISGLVQRQEDLQGEAGAVNSDLRLEELLADVGDPVWVGSAALGLMVRRDLDVTVVCPALGAAVLEAVTQIGARLAGHPRVWKVDFRNDTGHWNTDSAYPDGLYLGVRYRSDPERDWNLDVWFVDEPDRQPDLAHVRSLPARLTPENRAVILEIKDAWADRPEYGVSVRGSDIYRSVLDDGVRTLEQFNQAVMDR